MPQGGFNDVGMTLEDGMETFSLLMNVINDLKLGYCQLLRAQPSYFRYITSTIERATVFPEPVLDIFGPMLTNVPIILNGEVTAEEASKLVQEGKITAASFSMLNFNNPSLANRIRKGLTVNYGPPDLSRAVTWEKDPAEGYVFPEEQLVLA